MMMAHCWSESGWDFFECSPDKLLEVDKLDDVAVDEEFEEEEE